MKMITKDDEKEKEKKEREEELVKVISFGC